MAPATTDRLNEAADRQELEVEPRGPAGGPDDDPGAGALPAEPVGHLDVWAVAADESAATCVGRPTARRADAEQVAVLSARILAPHPAYRGGEVRVCDAAGNVWRREPIRAA